MATLFIPPRLRRLTAGAERVEAVGATVGALIDDVERRYPGFRAALTSAGELGVAVAVAIDGDIVAGGLEERVEPQSEVHFLPVLAGGA